MSTRDRVLLLLLFAGFATLAVEVRFEHRLVLKEDWQTYIPIVYSSTAALASLVALGGKKGVRTFAASVFFLGILVGVYGVYKHTQFNPKVFQKLVMPDAKVYRDAPDVNGDPVEVRIVRPVGAPLGVAGLAALGFVLTSGLFRSKAG